MTITVMVAEVGDLRCRIAVAEHDIHVYKRAIPRGGTDAMASFPNVPGRTDRVLGERHAA